MYALAVTEDMVWPSKGFWTFWARQWTDVEVYCFDGLILDGWYLDTQLAFMRLCEVLVLSFDVSLQLVYVGMAVSAARKGTLDGLLLHPLSASAGMPC